MSKEFKENFRQIFPVLVGALIPMSFGMMFAWPTLAYPYLMNKKVINIPFILDETSPVLGFLMEGNAIGAFFASSNRITCKTAICLSFILQIFGWLFMFYSKSICWFFASRISIGLANSYGTGQLKRYIKATCEIKVAKSLNNYLPLSFNVGLVVVIVLRSNINFRNLAFISGLIPMVGLAIFACIRQRKTYNEMGSYLPNNEENWGILQVLKDGTCRKNCALLFFLVFIQQYTGASQQIVYARLIYSASGNENVKLCAILYSIFFLMNMIISLKYAKKFNRKTNLLTSSLMCIICLSLVSVYFHFKQFLLNKCDLFVWAPLVLLIIYNFFHSFSFSTLSLLVISQHIPKQATNVVNKCWIIHYSLSAVICTKIFRILFGRYGMAMGYLLFASISVFGFVIISFMSDYTSKKIPSFSKEIIKEGKFEESINYNCSKF